MAGEVPAWRATSTTRRSRYEPGGQHLGHVVQQALTGGQAAAPGDPTVGGAGAGIGGGHQHATTASTVVTVATSERLLSITASAYAAGTPATASRGRTNW